MVFNDAFNNISAMSWRSVLVVEETELSGENRFSTCTCPEYSHNISQWTLNNNHSINL
jgi:hypothetical protein